MKSSKLSFFTLLGIILIIFYSLFFICYHFFRPKLGHLKVTTSSDMTYGMQYINLTTDKLFKKYYFLIYEEAEEENWIYFAPKSYDKHSEMILKQYLPVNKDKFILINGDDHQNSFSFSLKPKYPLSYLANKKHIFHIIYVVPFDFYIIPPFYYAKHFVFFIDPIY